MQFFSQFWMRFFHGFELNNKSIGVLLEVFTKFAVLSLMLADIDIHCHPWVLVLLDIKHMLGDLMNLGH